MLAQLSRTVRRRMNIFRKPHGYLHLWHLKERNRAICPYDYVNGGETLEKVGCSIGSAWVGGSLGSDLFGFQVKLPPVILSLTIHR